MSIICKFPGVAYHKEIHFIKLRHVICLISVAEGIRVTHLTNDFWALNRILVQIYFPFFSNYLFIHVTFFNVMTTELPLYVQNCAMIKKNFVTSEELLFLQDLRYGLINSLSNRSQVNSW